MIKETKSLSNLANVADNEPNNSTDDKVAHSPASERNAAFEKILDEPGFLAVTTGNLVSSKLQSPKNEVTSISSMPTHPTDLTARILRPRNSLKRIITPVLVPLNDTEGDLDSMKHKIATNNHHFQSPTADDSLKRRISFFKAKREVLIGTPVKEGHPNYILMYDMLTGIRISVSRCNAKPDRDIDEGDYIAAHKLAFDATGNELTPTSKYDFKFKDYCPWVFRRIRDCFHVDSTEYLISLTGKYVLSELGSPGKSGSFFYFSQDYRFIIKTIHRTEHDFILTILKDYYEHVKLNPHTLLSRIFGLHRVKQPGNKKIHFVVMGNVYNLKITAGISSKQRYS